VIEVCIGRDAFGCGAFGCAPYHATVIFRPFNAALLSATTAGPWPLRVLQSINAND
jgi:hypothetical protein